ncbi:hypothetical protein [Streptomyces halobius]|uniref:Uncharacterized protein n=1 Tax=Streptomyces halobius TaxID=2879846 RepID=A0ABY4M5H7_9ACTN|nr:hypothetical protein [Streptomyces halobius]UQA91621.1 hypothetical protein K9S39_06900 [Streptomyces halobius]
MAETPTEIDARQLIRAGLEKLLDDPDYDRTHDDLIGVCEIELQRLYDRWLTENWDYRREEAIPGGAEAEEQDAREVRAE